MSLTNCFLLPDLSLTGFGPQEASISAGITGNEVIETQEPGPSWSEGGVLLGLWNQGDPLMLVHMGKPVLTSLPVPLMFCLNMAVPGCNWF